MAASINDSAGTSDERLIDRTDALLLDLDGTVYHGARPIPEAVSALNKARSHVGLKYITNNASRSPSAVAEALQEMGIPASEDEVLTSAQAGVTLLTSKIPAGSRVIVLGSDSLKELVSGAGFSVVTSADDRPAAVIQGHATTTGWPQMSEAALAINNGAVYVATNMDTTLPTERGLTVGNGSMIAAITTATGVTPDSAGKPAGDMFTQAAEELHSDRPLAVGDRLNTDIAGGVAAGIPSLMVITGISGHKDLLTADPAERPTYIAADMMALFDPVDNSMPGPKAGWKAELASDGVLQLSSVDGEVPGGSSEESLGGADSSQQARFSDRRSHDALLTAIAAAWEEGAPAVTQMTATDSTAQSVIDTWR
ncbi:HAD-IIA family hydrolase [uncultured Corynebacterium sp.]|uniref:HAD-IIA family hydrolase n=1 Tax=uncultured Corynebacterium sp. TaxID=159447 RepID=UPI0025F99149|nr:HAD-IIA family hydrolase [uncultured Corynebacterium sp.]